MTTPKLKPGAEKIINQGYETCWGGVPPITKGEYLHVVYWTLANLPKLLEATEFYDLPMLEVFKETQMGKIFAIKGPSNISRKSIIDEHKPVAIVEVDNG